MGDGPSGAKRDPNSYLSNFRWVLFSLPSEMQNPSLLLLLILPSGRPSSELRALAVLPLPQLKVLSEGRKWFYFFFCHYSPPSLQSENRKTQQRSINKKQNNRNSTHLLRLNGCRHSLRHLISKPMSNTHLNSGSSIKAHTTQQAFRIKCFCSKKLSSYNCLVGLTPAGIISRSIIEEFSKTTLKP